MLFSLTEAKTPISDTPCNRFNSEAVEVIAVPPIFKPAADTTPEVFTRVTSAFPNWIVFDDVTFAFAPKAVEFVIEIPFINVFAPSVVTFE